MPLAGNGVAEGMDAPVRVEAHLAGSGKDHPRGANGDAGEAFADHAVADGAGGLVAAAGDHRGAGGQASGPGASGGDAGADLGPFESCRQPLPGNVQGGEHLLRPAAMADIEQARTAGVSHVGGALTGQAKTHEILRQQEMTRGAPDGWAVTARPGKLGSGEADQHGIAGPLDDALGAEALGPGVRFRLGAAIAPDDGRSQDGAGGIQQHDAVHLARQADRGDGGGGDGGLAQHGMNGAAGGAPPILGLLLGPEGVGHGDCGVGCGGGSTDAATRVH